MSIVTCITYEVKPLLPYFYPDDALSPQLRMNRGKLSPESVIVDHLLDNIAKLSDVYIPIFQDTTDCVFALVAFYQAASAKLQNFQENINSVPESKQGCVAEEEQALEGSLEL